jgi:hypothetical protein
MMMPKVAQGVPATELAQGGPQPQPEPADADDIDFVPTTDFGRRLLELRRRAIADGQPLLTRGELEREVAERRGGIFDGGER